MDRQVLNAPEGMVYTDGADVYGSEIYLAIGTDQSRFYLITRAEYDAICAERERADMP